MMLYGLLFALIILVDFFESNVPYFNYWDEFLTIAIVIWQFFKCKRISVRSIKQWVLLIGIILLGLLGNFLHPGIQSNNITIYKDIMAATKFFIVIYALDERNVKNIKQIRITNNAAKISRVIIVCMLVVAVITYPLNTSLYTGEVRIIKSFQFIFSHPTFLVTSSVLMMTVLIADSVEKNKIYLICNCIILFLAQRDKGYVALLLSMVILLLGEKRCTIYLNNIVESSKKSVWRWRALILLSIMVILAYNIGKEKINLYLGWGLVAARPALYIVGLKIAFEFFPIGSGFGTFASTLSVRNYSAIYDKYKISGVLGLTREYYGFAGDVFWPYIYGQFGVVGFVIYIKIMFNVLKRQLKSSLRSSDRLAILYLWIYILVASTAEAYFTNATAVQSAIILSVYIGYNNKRRDFNEKK